MDLLFIFEWALLANMSPQNFYRYLPVFEVNLMFSCIRQFWILRMEVPNCCIVVYESNKGIALLATKRSFWAFPETLCCTYYENESKLISLCAMRCKVVLVFFLKDVWWKIDHLLAGYKTRLVNDYSLYFISDKCV